MRNECEYNYIILFEIDYIFFSVDEHILINQSINLKILEKLYIKLIIFDHLGLPFFLLLSSLLAFKLYVDGFKD